MIRRWQVEIVAQADLQLGASLLRKIMPISSRLIVNQAALKMKGDLLQPVMDAFTGAVG